MSDGHLSADLIGLSQRLNYQFADPAVLRQAMAHRSWCAEVGGEPSNERLEFLGDAVLGWVIADLAFRRHHDLPEGKLTDLRKSMVNAITLAEVATDIDLGPCILLGKGEAAAGGARKASILSDAFEAVIGAVYLDGGSEMARSLIERLFDARLNHAVQRLDQLDYKTVLQELVARRFETAPVYVLTESGPDHKKAFEATVIVAGRTVGHGGGKSKKAAEQVAAEQACAVLTLEVAGCDPTSPS